MTPERVEAALREMERGVERRRLMADHLGAERIIRAGFATLLHEDETGRLWRRWVGHRSYSYISRNGEDTVMVEVVNSTPEPDGSRRTYLLHVPPSVSTAREAVAWTFGLRGDEYDPAQQT